MARPRAGRVRCSHQSTCLPAGWLGGVPGETRVLLSKKEAVGAWQKAPNREHKVQERLETLNAQPSASWAGGDVEAAGWPCSRPHRGPSRQQG